MPDMKTQTINGVVYDIVDQPGRENLAAHMNNQSNPHKVTAAQVGAAEMTYAKKIGAPHNLLDNSDFRNPVNQRGSASYSGKVYGIDRWKSNTGELVVTVADGYLQLTHSTSASGRASFAQNLGTGYVGRTFTVAICVHDTGNVYCASATVPNPTSSTQNFGSVNFNGSSARMDLNSNGELLYTIMVGRTEGENVVNVRWAALYEGEYTAETLPEYQPKGYAAELLECQRYYYRINFGWTIVAIASKRYAKSLRAVVPYPINMRAAPTVTIPNLTSIVAVGVDGNIPITNIEYAPYRQFVTLTITTETEVTHDAHGIYAGRDGAYIEASADL